MQSLRGIGTLATLILLSILVELSLAEQRNEELSGSWRRNACGKDLSEVSKRSNPAQRREKADYCLYLVVHASRSSHLEETIIGTIP